MKRSKRWMALFLCILMMTPTQGMAALAEAENQITTSPLETEIEETEENEEIERIDETISLEELENDDSKIRETLALEPLKTQTLDEAIIYWNPGGVLPEDLATASNAQTATDSNAQTATASNAQKGNDSADGLTPSTPVKTLAKALARAEELMEEEDILPSDITIYAMNPMEIADGQLYALNGGNLRIKSWPGRSYDSDVIFYVNGGQLILINSQLASGNPKRDEEDARLIYVRGGAYQMGRNVSLEGRIILDYRDESDGAAWELATASNTATASNVATTSKGTTAVTSSDDEDQEEEEESAFDIDEYIMGDDEDSMELIEDSTSASTWRTPIVELLEGFDDSMGEYLLEIMEDGDEAQIELVKTLYSDVETEEEFLSSFVLVENTYSMWSLVVETSEAGQVRNTGLSTMSVTESLTQKTLVAARASGTVIYWNPGGSINIGGTIYNAGSDEGNDGLSAKYPVKSWGEAVRLARDGTVVCMQTLDLGNSSDSSYLTRETDGSYIMESTSSEIRTSLCSWEPQPQPAINVPDGERLLIRNVELVSYNGTSSEVISCEKGTIAIDGNVIAETGYIGITAFDSMPAPIEVMSKGTISSAVITLLFRGINNNFGYCYTDVVVPIDALADRAATSAEEAEAVGLELQKRFRLHTNNTVAGGSVFAWYLRPDTDEDSTPAQPQNLELHAVHYYEAIYLNGETGNDDYYGATCQYPVKSWEKATERWAFEMKKSVAARRKAKSEGDLTTAEIEANFPIPKTIYICDTVTVNSVEEWSLDFGLEDSNLWTDYDGTDVRKITEVVSHTDIPYDQSGITLNHVLPNILVKVISGGSLTVKNITFRNITDIADSVTIRVEGGGNLTLTGRTRLTGQRLYNVVVAAKEVTRGTHVKVLSGTFLMDEQWTGAIEKRQIGIDAESSGAVVTMAGGEISENNSFDQEIYDATTTGTQIVGSGVILNSGARFTMNDGKITKNTVYQQGAGVYMAGAGTTFVMKKGEISENRMQTALTTATSKTMLRGNGIGIYAGLGTVLEIGTAETLTDDVQITKNTGFLADGVGIWSDSVLKIKTAEISDNSAGGYSKLSEFSGYNNASHGVGIYVGGNGTLTMEDAKVSDNNTSEINGGYGNAQGAGIFFSQSQETNPHIIRGTIISGNKISNESGESSSYSCGGGIYASFQVSSITIENCEIKENSAFMGGGIVVFSSGETRATTMTIKNTKIHANSGQGTRLTSQGIGGGIYFYGFGSLTLLEGVEITENKAAVSGGGIYLAGYSSASSIHLYMTSDDTTYINGNVASTGSGGGIYHGNASIHASKVEIKGNQAQSGGGGIYANTNGVGYLKEVAIGSDESDDARNQATNGGGLYVLGTYYMNDCTVEGNKASGSGGGIYLLTGTIHLTETSDGNFTLKGNQAYSGGGIFASTGALYMNIAGEIQNSASSLGSNLVAQSTFYILAGNFMQPEGTDLRDGVYNIYINDTTGNRKYFDMEKVKIEKKSGGNPDALYLHTTNSYLNFLRPPLDNDFATLPIDLNTEAFKPGSVVARPAAATLTTSPAALLEPNTALDGTVSVPVQYNTSYTNASSNLEYFSGGKLPRRTILGGYYDAGSTVYINMVVVGEGVYLSGSGNDNNGGTSPLDAVRTFTVAHEKLVTRITDQVTVDAGRPENEKTGFSPFIYICGQVNITEGDIETNKKWELNYDDDLFKQTNKYYKIAEGINSTTAYDAQVRRFASFVKEPMIYVDGAGASSPVEFTTEKIIINGMADAVIISEQGASSPIIRSTANTVVTLTGESQVTNNYYNGVDIKGKLIMTGEEGDTNKQLYNHHGNAVLLSADYASVEMRESARILTDAITKIGTVNGYGITVQAQHTNIKMESNSKIEQTGGAGLLSGGGIYSSISGMYATVNMEGSAAILSQGDTMAYGINLGGVYSQLDMKGKANITAKNTTIVNGIYISGSNTTVNMSGEATVARENSSATTNGIVALGTGIKIIMKDSSKITYEGSTAASIYGVTVAGGAQLIMGDSSDVSAESSAKITFKGASTGSSSIYVSGITISGESSRVTMEGYANVTYDMTKNTAACQGVMISGDNATLEMLGNSMITGGESNKLTSGVNVTRNSTHVISMNMNDGAGDNDSARIRNAANGVYFSEALNSPITIRMGKRAAIEKNQYGILERSSASGIGASKFELEMQDDSRISGNSDYGIHLNGWNSFTQGVYYHRITLKNRAVIGGSVSYNSAMEDSGNGYSGILANSPVVLNMSDESKISGNGARGTDGQVNSYGVYLMRTTSGYIRTGTAYITLTDEASICNNKAGVYVAASIGSYQNLCVIELNGIKEDGNLSSPSIKENRDGVYLGGDGTLKMKGGAFLGDTSYAASEGSLNCFGFLELDGRSTIEGRINLKDGTKPITMTHRVLDPLKQYKLYLSEGFLGQIVVKPGGEVVDLTTPYPQINYFSKIGGVGLADTNEMMEDAPNIILMGENNIYLSGSGNDSYTGNSRSTPVRTFARAKKLLTGDLEAGEAGGYFKEGANIIICTSVVEVLSGDTDWSFDEGGYVTNKKTHETWKPLVIRDKSYTGILVSLASVSGSLSAPRASDVTFKDITIDGGSEQEMEAITSTNSYLLRVGYGDTAILGEGAILQNNKSQTSNNPDKTAMGVTVNGGTLQIDGGIIRNMVRNTTTNTYGTVAFGSAISAQSGTTGVTFYPAKVIMNSGQIVDNQLRSDSKGGLTSILGTICLANSDSSLEMNGGLISNNTVTVMASNPGVGSALAINSGSATINGGIIRGNAGAYGSAIFYGGGTGANSKLILSGGQIIGNTTSFANGSTSGEYAPIYIQDGDFQLKGGGTDIRENIYLSTITSLVKISGNITQNSRLYRLYLNTAFVQGSVVVQPDRVNVMDATPYLSHFDVRTTPYILDQGRTELDAGVNQSSAVGAGMKENQCLILMKEVFLDSEKGDDDNDGSTPSKAVKTFTQAKIRGGTVSSGGTSDRYVIYVSGKVVNKSEETEWSLPTGAYMCRYTGFTVYVDSNGTPDAATNKAYYGVLIEPVAGVDLKLENIQIYGRRTLDTTTSNGDSLLRINSGVQVTIQGGVVLADNYNNGNYPSPIDGMPNNLASQGGAIHVAAGGKLDMYDGTIRNTEAARGSSIYLGASETDNTNAGRGRLFMTGNPEVSGKVHLGGTSTTTTTTATFVEVDTLYLPSTPLQISIGNDYGGRPVIQYPLGFTPGYDERVRFKLDDAIQGMYDVVNNTTSPNVLELEMRGIIYLDGKDGRDTNDGTSPDKAFKTLEQVYHTVKNMGTYGVIVFVVNTVDISGEVEPSTIKMRNLLVKNPDGTSHYVGYYQGDYENGSSIHVDIEGQVYFKRYVKPDGYNNTDAYSGFSKPTLEDTLFRVKEGGTLTLEGIYMDGHALNSENNIQPTLVAKGVSGNSPLVTVETGGNLICQLAEGVGVNTNTLFTNNSNLQPQKKNYIVVPNSDPVLEGSSAGIEVLGGFCELQAVEFGNLQLGDKVIGGTDVYNNGELTVSRSTYFNGTVYLEGFGKANDEASKETSRFITIGRYGIPVAANFQLLMRDAYKHRKVISYPTISPNLAPSEDIPFYLLEDVVKEFFYLNNREGEPNVFELQVPNAVYVNGITGDDNTAIEPEGRKRGSVPDYPVKTLGKAYELLNSRSAGTIYVVDTVPINVNTDITGISYTGAGGTTGRLGSTNKVRITRYLKPDFVTDDPSDPDARFYTAEDFNGPLLNIKDGGTLTLGNGIYIDGHSEPKVNTITILEYGKGEIVSTPSNATKAPLITLDSGGTLNLLSGATLQDNDNTYTSADVSGQNGGALNNSGTVNVNGGLFKNNKAEKGSVVYQNGEFNIQSNPENLKDHANAFYLTTSGGTDHVIQTAVEIPATMVFDVDMDASGAVRGRPVVKFTETSAYNPDVDTEHEHFKLGATVPQTLFLVESEDDPQLLELQNWKILKVEVPTSIYLVMTRKGTFESTTKLQGILAEAPADDLFTAPEYQIVNKGKYNAKVSISGFENKTEAEGIDTSLYPLMVLTDTAIEALGESDLYLAVKGLNNPLATGTGFGMMEETSLKPYELDPVTESPAVMGTLTPGTSGDFTFIAAVGSGFMDKYLDPDFPIDGSTGEEAQAHIGGTTSSLSVNARAKYLLHYKVEIDPARRESTNATP